MADLVVFVPGKTDAVQKEAVGSGNIIYMRYRKRRGFFKTAREKYALRAARGYYTADKKWADTLGCPLLCGEGTRLVHALCDRLVPKAAEESCLCLSIGKMWNTEAILRIAGKVRTMELIAPPEAATLAETVEWETGLSVPLLSAYRPAKGKIALRLPGGCACGVDAIDVSEPEKSCFFSPPPSLRALCTHTGSDGNTLEALLRFFDMPYTDAGIFCRNLQNNRR